MEIQIQKLLVGLFFNFIIIVVGIFKKRTDRYSKSFIPEGYLILAIPTWIFGVFGLYHIDKYQNDITLYSSIFFGYMTAGITNFFLFLKYKN